MEQLHKNYAKNSKFHLKNNASVPPGKVEIHCASGTGENAFLELQNLAHMLVM